MSGKLTYKESGVDTREAAALVGDIGTHVRRTQNQRQLYGAFGLFAAAFDLTDYKQPVIVTGCDGVGTKLELLLEHDQLEAAGIVGPFEGSKARQVLVRDELALEELLQNLNNNE